MPSAGRKILEIAIALLYTAKQRRRIWEGTLTWKSIEGPTC
jgi:hypothetical protein